MNLPLSPQQAAAELLRRRKARESLLGYANAIDIPGRPVTEDEDEWLFRPIETSVAAHHFALLQMLEGLALGTLVDEYGTVIRNGMVFMPPGSAKSTYTSVVTPTWLMGLIPEYRLILTSYATGIARKQGRRARQIARSPKFRAIWEGTTLSEDTSAAEEWALTNGSEFMAGGILSGVTGNRAHGLIIDDPVAGRQEADSEAMRKATREAYEDDLLTRLLPGAWQAIVQTRWNMDDLSGGILPAEWRGESGIIDGRDGQKWYVLCIPAEARENDPLGRSPGELLWQEWFTPEHFARYRNNPRTWSALFQQLPMPEEGDYFKADWLKLEDEMPDRPRLQVYGGSDYAVTDDGGDYTVHVVVGLDPEGNPWLLDLWRRQASSDVWVETFCDLVVKWRPIGWAEESGQIKGSVGPFLTRRQHERKAYVFRETFPTRGGNKAVRAQSIRGLMAMNGLRVHRNAPFLADLKSELLAFPAGAHDDQVDALGLVGQLIDKMVNGRQEDPPPAKPQHTYVAQSANHIRSSVPISELIKRAAKARSEG